MECITVWLLYNAVFVIKKENDGSLSQAEDEAESAFLRSLIVVVVGLDKVLEGLGEAVVNFSPVDVLQVGPALGEDRLETGEVVCAAGSEDYIAKRIQLMERDSSLS